MAEGKYVVIEGHDGTGKSTQVALLRDKLEQQGITSVEIHEPGGNPIADELRGIIKNGELSRDATTNLLLFTAARHELWRQVAVPALGKGEWVVAARNWYSTLAYQGYGEGLDHALIEQMTKQFTGQKYFQPDFACILTLGDHSERYRRINERQNLEAPDTFESRSKSFQHKVAAGYAAIVERYNLPVVDASMPPEAIATAVWQQIKGLDENH